jgi:hypothetical protein
MYVDVTAMRWFGGENGFHFNALPPTNTLHRHRHRHHPIHFLISLYNFYLFPSLSANANATMSSLFCASGIFIQCNRSSGASVVASMNSIHTHEML